MKQRLVKQRLVKQRLVKQRLVKQRLVKQRLVKQRLVKQRKRPNKGRIMIQDRNAPWVFISRKQATKQTKVLLSKLRAHSPFSPSVSLSSSPLYSFGTTIPAQKNLTQGLE
jgi:hypothetical protein